MHIRLKAVLLLVTPLLLMFAAAYIQWGMVGLPPLPIGPTDIPESVTAPYGYPA